jgi:iron(III) transport system ATP-binding protein
VASVELRGLTKRYGSAAVVDDISLHIEHGHLVCLLGPSGCGKTTTLRLIAGFIEPSGGEILVGNKLISSPAATVPPERRNMSMIFQSYALWPHMTVAENIVYGLKLRKLGRDVIAKKLDAILATTQLAALAQRYPGELSGGQQQRVALARALIVEPETLLLDEPLSNLDANLREEMRFEVRRLHDAYRYTTVYVTHDQSEAMTTADLICVMNGGKIEQSGSPEEIYDRPRSEFVARFIGSSNVFKGQGLPDGRHAGADRGRQERKARSGLKNDYTSTDLPVAEKMAKAFEAKYPGIAVRVERTGAERVFQRIGQEYASNIHAVDVVNSSDAAHFIVWKRDGMLRLYVPEDVAKFYPPEHKDPDGSSPASASGSASSPTTPTW